MWAVMALAIFHGCAGSSESSLLAHAIGTIISWTGLFHEIKYVNIKFIKMQNRATINFFLGTCMYVCAYIIPVMHSQDLPCAVSWGQTKQTRRDRLNSLLKCSILRNLMFLIDRNSHYYMYLENRCILKTTYVDV